MRGSLALLKPYVSDKTPDRQETRLVTVRKQLFQSDVIPPEKVKFPWDLNNTAGKVAEHFSYGSSSQCEPIEWMLGKHCNLEED